MPILAQKHNSELVFVDVKGDSGQALREGQEFIRASAGQPADMCNSSADLRDGADLAWLELRRKYSAGGGECPEAAIERCCGDAVFLRIMQPVACDAHAATVSS